MWQRETYTFDSIDGTYGGMNYYTKSRVLLFILTRQTQSLIITNFIRKMYKWDRRISDIMVKYSEKKEKRIINIIDRKALWEKLQPNCRKNNKVKEAETGQKNLVLVILVGDNPASQGLCEK